MCAYRQFNFDYRLMKCQLAFLLTCACVPIEYLSTPVKSPDVEDEEEEELQVHLPQHQPTLHHHCHS